MVLEKGQPRDVTRLLRIGLLLLTLTIVCVGRARADGMKILDEDGEEVGGDTTVVPVPNIKMPSHVAVATEGSLWELRRKHDIVVLAVKQQYDCSGCAQMLNDFATAAASFKDSPAGTVKFAVLDATEDADEFSLLVDEHPDAHWFIPCILVLKREYNDVRRRPPFNFLLNDNTARDLPRFVERITGGDYAPVREEKELTARVVDDATERVSFAVWPWAQPVRPAVDRVAEDERLHVYFSLVASGPLTDDAETLQRHNPGGHFVTAHIVKADGTVEVEGTSLEGANSFAAQVAAIRAFVEKHKLHRPGHEDDAAATVATEDLVPGGSCEGRRVTARFDMILVSFNITNLHTGSTVSTVRREQTEVGAERHDLPLTVAAGIFNDLCAPSKRKVVLPGNQHFSAGACPPGVDPQDRIRIDIELHEFVSKPLPPTSPEGIEL